jgi:hypothetical protein
MHTHLATASLLLFTGLASAQKQASEASPEATRYLEAALDQIEQGSRVYSTDWQALRTKALAAIAASGAKTAADTYPAIRDALATLGDKHGRCSNPRQRSCSPPSARRSRPASSSCLANAIVAQVVPGSPAAAAGLAAGDRIVAVEGVTGFADLPHFEFDRLFRCGQRQDGSTAPLELSVRTGSAEPRAVQVPLATFDEYLAPTGRRLDGDIGYLELPGVSRDPRPRITTTRCTSCSASSTTARCAAASSTCGATRRQRGADARQHRSAGGHRQARGLRQRPQQLRMELRRGARCGDLRGLRARQGREPHPLRDDLPVAVLTGPMTAQAGEALVVAFAGRARTVGSARAPAACPSGARRNRSPTAPCSC